MNRFRRLVKQGEDAQAKPVGNGPVATSAGQVEQPMADGTDAEPAAQAEATPVAEVREAAPAESVAGPLETADSNHLADATDVVDTPGTNHLVPAEDAVDTAATPVDAAPAGEEVTSEASKEPLTEVAPEGVALLTAMGDVAEEQQDQPSDMDLQDAEAADDTLAPAAVEAPEIEFEPAPEDIEATHELDELDEFGEPLLAAEHSTSDVPTGVLSSEHIEGQTSPLTAPVEREELTALPINAVVDGRYVVQNLLHHGQDRNLYRVATRKQQRCLTCGRVVSAEIDTCPHCDSALTGQPTADFYLMAESYRPDALMQDPDIMESNLYHPNLVPVIDFFSHKPFGHMRYYAVAEPRQGVRLSQLSLPRPGGQVLNWAMQLSDALDYLHSRGVVGAGAEADDILVQGDRASLASLQNARANVDTAEELAQQQSMDLARLASTMYEAFTGHPAAMSPEGILPMPSSAPEQVGTAFRSAIEPAQGIASPINASHWRDLLASALEAVAELERPGRPIAFASAGLTDVGRLREQNQDSFGMIEFTQASVERPMRLGLYLIADGLGGHKGGEIASAIAVQAFCGEIMSRIISSLVAASGDRSLPGNDAILQGMVRAVQAANERIYKARDNRQNDMGTTVVAALIAGGKAYIVNVGDSRIYLYSRPRQDAASQNGNNVSPVVKGTSPLAGTTPLKGTNVLDATAAAAATQSEVDTAPIDRSEYVLTQVSVDHSLVHRLVELGQLDPEEAKVHPHRNFIYRSLGGPPPIEVDTFVRTLHPGDRLLLCSDGLNSMIEDGAMEEVLASTDDPELAAQRLIDLANDAGGHDNITTVVIDATSYLPFPEHPTALTNM